MRGIDWRIAAFAAVAFLVAYYAIIKKHKLSTLRLLDVIAPCVALGLCLGRVGCLLNGCCYGEVACANCAVPCKNRFMVCWLRVRSPRIVESLSMSMR